jgi:hypothetical protein
MLPSLPCAPGEPHLQFRTCVCDHVRCTVLTPPRDSARGIVPASPAAETNAGRTDPGDRPPEGPMVIGFFGDYVLIEELGRGEG